MPFSGSYRYGRGRSIGDGYTFKWKPTLPHRPYLNVYSVLFRHRALFQIPSSGITPRRSHGGATPGLNLDCCCLTGNSRQGCGGYLEPLPIECRGSTGVYGIGYSHPCLLKPCLHLHSAGMEPNEAGAGHGSNLSQ